MEWLERDGVWRYYSLFKPNFKEFRLTVPPSVILLNYNIGIFRGVSFPAKTHKSWIFTQDSIQFRSCWKNYTVYTYAVKRIFYEIKLISKYLVKSTVYCSPQSLSIPIVSEVHTNFLQEEIEKNYWEGGGGIASNQYKNLSQKVEK